MPPRAPCQPPLRQRVDELRHARVVVGLLAFEALQYSTHRWMHFGRGRVGQQAAHAGLACIALQLQALVQSASPLVQHPDLHCSVLVVLIVR